MKKAACVLVQAAFLCVIPETPGCSVNLSVRPDGLESICAFFTGQPFSQPAAGAGQAGQIGRGDSPQGVKQ